MADKGLAFKRVMQTHSDDGVFSVMPFRGAKEEPERAAALDPTGRTSARSPSASR